MANVQKCVSATEVSNDSLLGIIRKALGYPKRGAHIGAGIHVTMPDTYDGTGIAPPGWTKQPVGNWVNTALDSAVPVPDALVAELQLPGSVARITPAEQTALASALLAIAPKDLESAAYIPKTNSAAAAKEGKPNGSPP